jgi:predicted phosphohydrolase
MAYSSNYKPVLAETGEYEATLINADVRTAGNGSQYLNLAFNLDNNIRVYDKIWRDAVVPTDFNHQRVADLLVALNIDEELEDDFALIQAIKGKKLIVSVVKEFNDKTQKEVNNIKAFKSLVEINEEDLPF